MTRIHVPVHIRWNDLDAYGHVNNAAMLTLLEEARISVFWTSGDVGPGEPPGTAVIDARPGSATVTLVARQEAEYLAPIPYLRKPLDVQLWIGRLGGASIEVCYEVCSPLEDEPQVVYARAATTVVLVDAVTQQTRRIDDRERAAWTPFLEPPIEFRRR